MEDYYAVVDLSRTASAAEIDRRIRDQLRIWQRRTSNADLNRRQEAERRVQLLSQARAVLLDPDKRRDYDRQLAGGAGVPPASAGGAPGRVPGAPVPLSGDAGPWDWLARARQQLADNDYQAAAYAARQARDAPDPPPETWGVLARASAGLGRLDDALYEARHAVSLAPQSAQAHLDLAHVHEQRGDWTQAFEAYEAASRLDPQAEAPAVGMSRALASAARPADAVDRLERRYAQAPPPDRAAVGRLLGRALVTTAERMVRGQMTRGEGDQQAIPSPRQEHEIGRLLRRARTVTADLGVLDAAATLERELARRRQQPPTRSAPRRHPTSPVGSATQTNPLAVASLVLALIGMCLLLPAPVGAVLGHVARHQIRERQEQGDGLAQAGIIIGWLVTAAGCCLVGYVVSFG